MFIDFISTNYIINKLLFKAKYTKLNFFTKCQDGQLANGIRSKVK